MTNLITWCLAGALAASLARRRNDVDVANQPQLALQRL